MNTKDLLICFNRQQSTMYKWQIFSLNFSIWRLKKENHRGEGQIYQKSTRGFGEGVEAQSIIEA
jgi:hypothetical protein